MSIILTIISIIVSIIFLALVFALFVEKNYSITKTIKINAQQSDVFNFVKLLRKQNQYNVWVRKDPNVKLEYFGVDGEVGAINRWEGNKQAGKGEQEIIAVSKASVNLELRFEKPFKNVGYTEMVTVAKQPEQTEVIWIMKGKTPYPINLMTFLLKGVLGKDMETSLLKLKNILENEK